MKRIFILIFFLITKHTYSQLTLPFPDSSASWVITEGGGSSGQWQYGNYRYFCNGDTVINGTSYKLLKYSNNLDPIDTISSIVVGYYRIDGQKVFYLQDSSFVNGSSAMYNSSYFNTGQEILLYDFGIQIGDTFSLSDSTLGNTIIVLTQIDTIQFSSEVVRRFIFTSSNFGCFTTQYYYWYYGIGSTYGFFPNFYCFENGITFDCFHENNVDYVFYLQPGDDCMNITLGEDRHVKSDVATLFPNPSEGLFSIFSDFSDGNAIITDLMGKFIISIALSKGNNVVNIQNISSGIYLLKTKAGVEKILIHK